MSYSIYLGDVDPNSPMINRGISMAQPYSFRKQIMFELLMNKSVVMSDSQFLTDPRLQMLMSGHEDIAIQNPHQLKSVEAQKKDFEKLVENGLIEVAMREKNGQKYTFADIWTGMSGSSSPVPYLPADGGKYAAYLDSLLITKKHYELSEMGGRFKHNLICGTEDTPALILNPHDETDQELRRMFHAPSVLQRDILDFITRQKANGRITQARLEEIYDYTFGCYNVNISAYLNDTYSNAGNNYNCLLSSEARHMPIHLESTVGNRIVSANEFDFKKLRPISYWAFDDVCLSLLSTEAFLELRKRMQTLIDEDMMMVFRTGNITNDNYYDFVEYWNDFASELENATRIVMHHDYVRIDDELKRLNKYMTTTERLEQLHKEGTKDFFIETVNLILTTQPVLGGVFNAVVVAGETIEREKEISECVSNIPTELMLQMKQEAFSAYLGGDKGRKILTKYKPNFKG